MAGQTNTGQPGTMAGQTNTGQPGSSSGSAANSPAASAQPQAGTPAMGSGPRFQVSNLEKVSGFCNMPQPH